MQKKRMDEVDALISESIRLDDDNGEEDVYQGKSVAQ
jgi:hypothetical protein